MVRLRFTTTGGTNRAGGELVLDTETGLVRFIPADALRADLEANMAEANDNLLKWLTTILYVLAALGAFLWMRGKKRGAGAAFGAAMIAGAGGGAIRSTLRRYLAPVPLDEVSLSPLAEGGLRIRLGASGPRATTITLQAGEFAPDEAEGFRQTLEMLRSRVQ